jgi:hypothetical protein
LPTITPPTCASAWKWGCTSWQRDFVRALRGAFSLLADEVDAALRARTRAVARAGLFIVGAVRLGRRRREDRISSVEEPVRKHYPEAHQCSSHRTPAITSPCGGRPPTAYRS